MGLFFAFCKRSRTGIFLNFYDSYPEDVFVFFRQSSSKCKLYSTFRAHFRAFYKNYQNQALYKINISSLYKIRIPVKRGLIIHIFEIGAATHIFTYTYRLYAYFSRSAS